MRIVIDGQTAEIPRGPSGPDGNPVGTVISFLGKSAPQDYLVCDGAEYSVTDYPKLAAFFEAQFGAANHFGGDGTDTFAVPDMRNLFLRGYHGAAGEQLSGEIGAKQEATKQPTISTGKTTKGAPTIVGLMAQENDKYNFPRNTDTEEAANAQFAISQTLPTDVTQLPFSYTSRPVNMAVLYCVKAA